MLKLYLVDKDANASAFYDYKTNRVKVLKGSTMNKKEVRSFETHNYYKLRQRVLKSGAVKNFVFIRDYEFESPSASSSLLLGSSSNGPLEWKLEDGRTLKEYLKERDNQVEFIEYYNEKKHLKMPKRAYEQAKEFRSNFPVEKIKNMTIADYDKIGSKKTFCYNLERKTTAVTGGSFYSSNNKLFFEKDGEYKNIKHYDRLFPNLSIEEKFSDYREELASFIINFDKNNYVAPIPGTYLKGSNYIKSKLVNIYYPNTILAIGSIYILRQMLQYFHIKPAQYNDSIEMSIALSNYILEIVPEANKIAIWDLSEIIYHFYEDIINVNDYLVEEDDEDVYNDEITNEDLFLEDKLISEIITLIKRKKNVIFQGPPGVGKTFSVDKILKNNFEINNSAEQILTIQFHQSYSYEEFIEGLRPNRAGNGFTERDGILKSYIKDHVLMNKKQKYFLIIDEINRGNLSKIFGELLMLIEADKRGEKHSVKLPYSQENFYIPENLYIIGTMNTADRSLALIDYALRRRFSFVDFEPKYNTYKFNKFLRTLGLSESNIDKINKTMKKINKIIINDLGHNFAIGHSYFVDKDIKNFDNWYNNIIKYEIIPLLNEYYFDDLKQVEKIKNDLNLNE